MIYDTVIIDVYTISINSGQFNPGRTQLVECIGPGSSTGLIGFFPVLPSPSSLIQSVTIDWGDGVSQIIPPSGYASLQTHSYQAGSYSLTITVVVSAGCSTVLNYSVFVGSSPSPAGLALFVNQSNGCLPHATSFTFNVPSANVDGTTYEVDWGDGSPTVTYIHPNTPPVLNHVYGQSSCGNSVVNSGTTYYNVFQPFVITKNPCSVQPQTSAAGIISVGVPPDASFNMSIDTVLKEIQLVNTSDFGLSIPTGSGANCDTVSPYYWTITPNNSTGAANWSIVSGSLGSNNGFPGNKVFWTIGSIAPRIKFLVSGTYIIDLFVENDCGLSQYSDTVIISQGQTCYISETFNESACSSYTWSQNGTTYVTSGFYYDTIINNSGCDSILALNLTINPQSSPASLALFVNQANGCLPHATSFTFNVPSANVDGTTYEVDWGDGSPTVTYTHPITPPVLNHVYGQSSCGNSVVASGTNYSNVFQPFVITQNPCSVQPQTSAAGLISVGVPPDASFNMSIDTVLKEIQLVNTSDFGLSIPTGSGANCDTVSPYYWTITPNNSAGTTNWSVVSGSLGSNNGFPGNTGFWTIGSMAPRIKFFVSGTYVIDLFVENDCGLSQYTVQVIFTQSQEFVTREIFTEEVCNSFTWNQNGVTYTSSGLYEDTLTNSIGYDSIIALNLTINNSTTGVDIQTACDSYTWINGVTYTSSNNTATQTLTNTSGCDSVVTLNLTINNSTTGVDVQTACDSYTWINGVTYTSSNNTATDTLTNTNGCDSVVTLNLTINNSNIGTDVQTACDSYTWINGVTYTSSNNTATQTLTNAAGCDSVVTLNLTINNSNTGVDVQTACDSYTWINGVTYTSSNNTATQTLTNSAGCDSVVTLNLTITNSSSATDVVSSCNSYTWINGVTYTSSNNTATQTLTNSAGCDSVVTLNLTINNSNTGTDVQTACNSYTWIDGITYTASNNTATDTLTNAAGCDSVVTLNLTITNSPLISQPINQTVNIGNNAQFQFLTSGTSLNYQWQMDVGTGYVNLSNTGQFSGADTNLLTVSNVNMANNNTNFRCIITESSTCKDTTNSVKLFVSSGTSIIEQTNSLVNLYPNPTSDFVTINLANKSKGQVIVLDLLGKVVLNKEFNSNQIQLSLKSIESKGTYLVKIIDSNGNVIANKKLIYQ